MKVFLVGLAGALGAVARYGIGVVVGVRSFPWSTLGINIAGSFALGLVLRVAVERRWPETTSVPLAVGFLGAFTTFSTFSYETYTLLRTNRESTAAIYVLASLVGGILAAGAGYTAARSLA